MRIVHLLPALVVGVLVALGGCSSDKRDGATSASAAKVTGAGGEAVEGLPIGLRLGVPPPLSTDAIPGGCPYDASAGWFVCASETGQRGETIARRYAFFDAEAQAQSSYDPMTTASLQLEMRVDGEVPIQDQTGTIHRESALTASGLAGAERARTWNGTMLERTHGLPPRGPGGEPPAGEHPDFSGLEVTVGTTIQDVVMPHPLSPETWPSSGSIARTVEITGSPNGVERHTSLLTFNGTRYASLSVDGGEATALDLKNPPRRHVGSGRPGDPGRD